MIFAFRKSFSFFGEYPTPLTRRKKHGDLSHASRGEVKSLVHNGITYLIDFEQVLNNMDVVLGAAF
jgi:hypothetical protein